MCVIMQLYLKHVNIIKADRNIHKIETLSSTTLLSLTPLHNGVLPMHMFYMTIHYTILKHWPIGLINHKR